MRTFLCPDSPEGVLTGIYEAWVSGVPDTEIRLELGTSDHRQLSFTEELREVKADLGKADQVLNSVRRLGQETYEMAEGALLSSSSERAEALFRFFRYAFRVKRNAASDLTIPEVMRVFELNRRVRGEAHLLLGFIRFSRMAGGIYYAEIGPKNDVLPLLGDHFAKRFNTQSFVIYDGIRNKSLVSPAGGDWFFLRGTGALDREGLAEKDDYEKLWQVFFESIAIRERENPLCQRTHLPLRYRRYMTEFTGE